jgi:uncharacterized coiled-coil DUF342 family protein
MSRGRNENPGVKTAAKDLDPYRRLVELQKQMIELAQQYERTKRQRDALHEQMVHEAAGRRHDRRGLRHRLQWSAAQLLKRVPGFMPEKTKPARSTINHHRHAESH